MVEIVLDVKEELAARMGLAMASTFIDNANVRRRIGLRNDAEQVVVGVNVRRGGAVARYAEKDAAEALIGGVHLD